MTYTALDAIFCLVILFFAITAAAHGLINEIFGKASFVVGVIAAMIFTPVLEVYVLDTVKNAGAARVLSFLIIFVMAFLILRIVQGILKKLFSLNILKSLDRALGLMLGVVEGVVAVALVIFVLKAQPWFDTEHLLHGSLFVRILGGVVDEPAAHVQSMAV